MRLPALPGAQTGDVRGVMRRARRRSQAVGNGGFAVFGVVKAALKVGVGEGFKQRDQRPWMPATMASEISTGRVRLSARLAQSDSL